MELNNLNFEINLEDYLPKSIIPRQGKERDFVVEKNGDCLNILCNGLKPITLKNRIFLSERDLQAIGIYFAEGIIYVNYDRKIHHSGEIGVANSDEYCLNVACDLFEKFSIKRSDLAWRIDLNKRFIDMETHVCQYWINKVGIQLVKRRKVWLNITGTTDYRTPKTSKYGCLQLVYNSTLLRSIFIHFCFKLFDNLVERGEKNKVAAILAGHFAGDGNVNFNPKNFRREMSFLGNKKEVLDRIRKGLVLLDLERIKETFPERTKTHTKAIRIYNKRDNIILDKYKIPYIIDYKREKFKQMINSYAGVSRS